MAPSEPPIVRPSRWRAAALAAAFVLAPLLASGALAGSEEAPPCPTRVRARPLAHGDVRVAWQGSAEADTYRVERASGDGELETVAETGQTSYLDDEADIHTSYRYRVTAANDHGQATGCPVVEAAAIPTFANPATVGLALLAGLGLATVLAGRGEA